MRPIDSVLWILLMAGCAAPSQKFETRSYQQIQKEKEIQEDRNFFYGGWLPQRLSPQKPENSQTE